MRVNLKRVIDLYQRARRTSYMSWYRNQYVKHKDFGKSILIESTHGSDFYGHMFYMTRELSRQFPEMKLYVALTKDKMSSVRTQLSEEGLTNVSVVEFLSKTYCRLLASCHYLLNDTSFYPFFIKQPFQKYINIWHGTPLKCLGKDNGDARNLGNVQKNFFSSDVLLVSNSYTRQAMIQSFNLDRIMRGKVVVGPSPRNSILMDDNQRKLMRDKYDLHDKEAFVYMPTWRGGVSKVQNKTGEIESYLVRLDRSLSDNQVLFVKLHPFQEKLEQIDFSPYKHIRKFPSDVESYAFLSGTDGLITDYSSIMYDYMNTGKPIALFVYDKEDYYSSRGCYEDIDDYPFPKFSDIDQLCDWISQKSHTSSYDDEFKNKYTELDNVEGAAQIAKYIMSGDSATCGAALDELCPYNGKPTVIIYAGTLWENGITAALFNTLNTIDLDERNYVVVLNKNNIKIRDQWRLYALPEGVQFYPLNLGPANNLVERLMVRLHLENERFSGSAFTSVADRVYQREFERLFGGLKPEAFLHYTGYERIYAVMISAMRNTPVKTAIFMHNDMVAEHEAKGKGMNWQILTRAYRTVDSLVFVNEEQRKDFLTYMPEVESHAVVVNNFMGSEQVREKASLPVAATLIEAPVVLHHDRYVLGFDLRTRNYLGLELDKPNGGGLDRTVDALNSQYILSTGKFNHLQDHMDDFKQALNLTLPKGTNLPEDFEVGLQTAVGLLGITKSQLLDDLYNPNIKVFSNIGRMASGKSHDRLIHSFIEVHKRYPDTRLLIIASYGDMKESIKNWIAHSGCADAIYFIAGMSNPYAVLKLSDAFVFTSRYEALGLVVFEALAVNTDVVTVSIPATVARLDPGNAMVVDNTQKAITKGWLEYLKNGYTKTPYDFAKRDNQSIREFESLFLRK